VLLVHGKRGYGVSHLYAELPSDRTKYGKIWVLSDSGSIEHGPFECYGKADNQRAAAHNNASRNPLLPYGDHPLGDYRVVMIQAHKLPVRSYGPFFILLDPEAGDARTAEINGRTGLAIHGGDPATASLFRPTEGCLRVTNEAVTELVKHVRQHDLYTCSDMRDVPGAAIAPPPYSGPQLP